MKNKIIGAVLWFFGLVFIVRGITLIGESFLGSILMLLAGVLMLPPIQKKIADTNPSIKGLWLGVGIFFLLSFSGMFLQASEKKALENGTASPELLAREADRKARAEEQRKATAEREATKAAEKERRDREREARDRAIAMEMDAEIALKKFLKDPDSAQIRNQHGYCGEVNSKNSFGGYTGFKRFIASSAIVAIEGDNMDSYEFDKAWDQVCA
ncbi:hypothetical protein [Acinetobacter thermotolerans]|uniref:hypothetical protein n=1 Tax=Acinetobacter thermotolerans TaxID=3151487 RepID=UPI00325BE83C